MPEKLSSDTISKLLKQELANWEEKEGKLVRNFQFSDFKKAFSFMSLCALKAEEMNHHPDWYNVYNRLEVQLSTHSIGGISELDVELAKFMETNYQSFKD